MDVPSWYLEEEEESFCWSSQGRGLCCQRRIIASSVSLAMAKTGSIFLLSMWGLVEKELGQEGVRRPGDEDSGRKAPGYPDVLIKSILGRETL